MFRRSQQTGETSNFCATAQVGDSSYEVAPRDTQKLVDVCQRAEILDANRLDSHCWSTLCGPGETSSCQTVLVERVSLIVKYRVHSFEVALRIEPPINMLWLDVNDRAVVPSSRNLRLRLVGNGCKRKQVGKLALGISPP